MIDEYGGPHFDSSLFLPNGKLSRLHKGGAPKVNKKHEAMQYKLMQAQLKKANEKIKMPEVHVPPPPPPTPPPPDSSSQDVVDAEQDARRRAQKKTNAGKGTLFAGETGGYQAGTSLGGAATLLG